jgi:predicted RNase H-like HicB family nuclease
MSERGELTFDITQESDGGFVAEALGENIVTQADTWEQLRENVREAVALYFDDCGDQPKPATIRLHLRKDEVFALA